MKRKFIIIITCVLLSACLLCSCAQTPAEETSTTAADDGKISIVTTAFPEYDFCRQIAGDAARVTMLLSPGEEVHSFEPTPQDIVELRNADVFVYGGGESDVWADNILSSVKGSDMAVVSLMDCVPAIEEEIKEGMETDATESDSGTEYDEHVWTSPLNAVRIVNAIKDVLCEADEENAALYTSKAESYVLQLNQLDESFRNVVSVAKRKTLIFADRFPLLYFVKEYGLDYTAAFPGCSSETQANPMTVSRLIKQIKEEEIPIVFKIEMSSDSMAKTVSAQTGAEIMTFYTCQTITKDAFNSGESYISLMQRNLKALEAALI